MPVGYHRKRRSEVTGMRLAPDARDLLDREVERSGRYPATIVTELIRTHLSPKETKGMRHEPVAPIAADG